MFWRPSPLVAAEPDCLLSSAYGFAAGKWPFGVVELIWAGVAFNRWRNTPSGERRASLA